MSNNKIISFIPNSITLLNSISGCISIVFALEGNTLMAGIFIFVAALFDFFDGMAARLLNAYSDIGKQLDSLADAISFGAAPSVIAYTLLKDSLEIKTNYDSLPAISMLLISIPFIMVAFSILRLAKFNIDSRQTDSFIGLPTPANAIMWASFPLAIAFNPDGIISEAIQNPYVIISLSVLMSILLVSELPLFSLKFKTFSFKPNALRYIFLTACIGLIVAFTWYSIPAILITYILLSLFTKNR